MERTEKSASLTELSCKSMVQNAGQHKLLLDTEKFPASMGKDIWEHCELMEIITLAANTNQLDWFSQNVTKPISFLQVDLTKCQYSETELGMFMECANKHDVEWRFTETPFDEPGSYMLKIGNQSFQTSFQMEERERKFYRSYRTGEGNKTLLVDWLCELFRCGVNSMIVDGESNNLDKLKSWPRLMEPDSLKIERCQHSEFLHSVLLGRNKKNGKTLLKRCQFVDSFQIPVECLKNVGHRATNFNLTNFDIEQLIQFANCLSDDLNIIRATIPELTHQDLNHFKESLSLSECEDPFNPTLRRCLYEGPDTSISKHRLFYKINPKDSDVLVFRFYENDSGVFDRLTIDYRPRV